MHSCLLCALVCYSYPRLLPHKTQRDFNCTVGFFYPEGWKNFISDSSDCEQSYTEINFPQPSLSEKILPSILIQVENCCEFITSRDETGLSNKM